MRPFRSLLPLWLALAVIAAPAASFAQLAVGVSIRIAPPPLPVYVQPPLPGPGYLWTPGYWAYGPAGYYWVPGTWVLPPAVGLLWTPGYWGWSGGAYVWYAGYWGPHVGFYGGVNYGFGYGGVGFAGGFWNHGVFNYNRAVANVGGVRVAVYNKAVVVNRVSHVSFNGGPGGLHARPTPQEEAAARDPHNGPTGDQQHHENAAAGNHALLASENHGRPGVAATSRVGEFSGRGVVAARNVSAKPQPPHLPAQPHPEQGEHHEGEEHRR